MCMPLPHTVTRVHVSLCAEELGIKCIMTTVQLKVMELNSLVEDRQIKQHDQGLGWPDMKPVFRNSF